MIVPVAVPIPASLPAVVVVPKPTAPPFIKVSPTVILVVTPT